MKGISFRYVYMVMFFLIQILYSISYAISQTSVISPDVKSLLTKILFRDLMVEGENIDRDELMLKIYRNINFAFEDSWHAFWIGNDSWAKSKFKDSKNRFVLLTVNNNDRMYHFFSRILP